MISLNLVIHPWPFEGVQGKRGSETVHGQRGQAEPIQGSVLSF